MKIDELNKYRNDASHYSVNKAPELNELKNLFNKIVVRIMQNTEKED